MGKDKSFTTRHAIANVHVRQPRRRYPSASLVGELSISFVWTPPIFSRESIIPLCTPIASVRGRIRGRTVYEYATSGVTVSWLQCTVHLKQRVRTKITPILANE